MPSGWKLDESYSGADGTIADASLQPEVATCLGVPYTLAWNDLPHDYVQLSDPSGGGVMSTVTVFPSIAEAREVYLAASAALAPSCRATAMRAVYLANGYGVNVTGAFLPTGIPGDVTVIRETVQDSTTSATTHEDFFIVRRGPVIVYIDIQAPSVDELFEFGLLGKSLVRLKSLRVPA